MTEVNSVEKEIERYKKLGANLLGPSIHAGEVSQFHKIIVDSVLLSVDPNDGDVYSYKKATNDQPAQFIIAGQGLQRLAMYAGIVWSPNDTRATSQSQKYVAYRAVGSIRKSDGTFTGFQAEYDIDIDIVEDDLRENFAEKRKKWSEQQWFQKLGADGQNNYIETAIRKELNFKKKHKTKIAASGAKNRVIRVLLGIKKTYTLAELKKPFVIPRVVLRPNYNDPDVKKMMLVAAIQAQTSIFGAAPSQLLEDYVQLPEEDPPIDIPISDFDNEDPPGPETPDNLTSKKADFLASDNQSKITILDAMAKMAGYDLHQIKKPLDKFTEEELEGFFDRLDDLLEIPF